MLSLEPRAAFFFRRRTFLVHEFDPFRQRSAGFLLQGRKRALVHAKAGMNVISGSRALFPCGGHDLSPAQQFTTVSAGALRADSKYLQALHRITNNSSASLSPPGANPASQFFC